MLTPPPPPPAITNTAEVDDPLYTALKPPPPPQYVPLAPTTTVTAVSDVDCTDAVTRAPLPPAAPPPISPGSFPPAPPPPRTTSEIDLAPTGTAIVVAPPAAYVHVTVCPSTGATVVHDGAASAGVAGRSTSTVIIEKHVQSRRMERS